MAPPKRNTRSGSGDRKARKKTAPARTSGARDAGGGWPWLLGYFALSVAGVFAVLLTASRRQRFERRWEDLPELEPPEPEVPSERPQPSIPAVAREIAGPAGRLFVDDGGMVGLEPPVLFVHGLGGTSSQWRAQLAHLRPARRAVAFDLRGHGDSDRVGEGHGYTVSEYVDDLATVADALALDRFVLAGHSLGATVAIELAGRWPERVAGLLLVDPNGDQTQIPGSDLEPFLGSLAKDSLGEMEWYFKQILVGSRPEVADQVLADLQLTDPAAFPTSLSSSFETSPLPALERYPGPRLSVISDLNALPYSLHNLLEDLPRHLMTQTSHWLMMDRPEDFNELMDGFLERVDQTEGGG